MGEVFLGMLGRNSNLFIHWDKQGKHIEAHSNYNPNLNRSILTSNAQMLLELYAGKGEAYENGEGFNQRERFVHFDIIGFWINKNGTMKIPTTSGIIHYSKDGGAHIVPAKPQAFKGDDL